MMTPLGAMSRSDLQINKNILQANSLNIFQLFIIHINSFSYMSCWWVREDETASLYNSKRINSDFFNKKLSNFICELNYLISEYFGIVKDQFWIELIFE